MTDIDKLIEELQSCQTSSMGLCDRAADAIAAQSARIEELEACVKLLEGGHTETYLAAHHDASVKISHQKARIEELENALSPSSDSIGKRTTRGYNTITYSGFPFWPLQPNIEDIRIEDIAHSLSMICRFNGHTKNFYSVAQHSVLASEYVSSNQLGALLHDAAEAYVGDMVRPLKKEIPWFVEIEHQIQKLINQKFGVDTFTDEIREVDNRLVWTERRDLLQLSKDVDWGPEVEPFSNTINSWSPSMAEELFLSKFHKLKGGSDNG